MRQSARDDFDGHDLDRERWLPCYLPQWSSRAGSAATYVVESSELRLTVAPDQALWCADTHPEPLRLSGVQSGVFSGPVGSTVGQQPFAVGQRVREEQPAWFGWTVHRGRVDVVARMDLSSRSMASVWMVGLEDEPDRCGEICVFEVFGETIDDGHADIGQGLHRFRDPALIEEFSAQRRHVDVRRPHTYSIDWRPGGIDFLLDGRVTSSSPQSPAYPMQLMVAVFDFPTKIGPSDHVPLLAVDSIAVTPSGAERSF